MVKFVIMILPLISQKLNKKFAMALYTERLIVDFSTFSQRH